VLFYVTVFLADDDGTKRAAVITS